MNFGPEAMEYGVGGVGVVSVRDGVGVIEEKKGCVHRLPRNLSDTSNSSLDVLEVFQGAVMIYGSVAGAGQATNPPPVTWDAFALQFSKQLL
ncbi:MAG: hypothetical protein GY832_44200 [Chloroflexi bacterium]|nr:hypothetical protein [Chloroflexota bacterium]